MSPIHHAGHPSFPSGHATQGHVFAALLTAVIPASFGQPAPTPSAPGRTTVGVSLGVLARRLARNREIVGLHYPSDTKAGIKLAGAITTQILLDPAYLPKFKVLLDEAKLEWANPGAVA
jgi:membrane-associated phospholipid phosphatase